MKIIQFLKKTLITCFTDNPYRFKKFDDLYAKPIGQAVDQPESLSAILKYEAGENENYSNPVITINQEVNHRIVDHIKRFKSTGIFRSPDRYVYNVSDGCIIGQLGLVYDAAKRCFIDESAMEWNINLKDSSYTNAINLPPKNYLKGITISYLTNGADGGFYHFLFESVTKTGLLNSILQQADQLLFNGPSTSWKLKWLHKAGIDTSKIIWMNNMSHYQCEQLIFTNKVIADQQIGKWGVNTLRKIFNIANANSAASTGVNMIWLSRKGLNNRTIAWEDDILSLFPDMESVDLSLLSVDETIAKLQYATHIIGPHGAAFSNLYLCKPSTKVLEIYPNGSNFQPCYHRLSESCELDHSVIYLDFKNQENPATGINLLIDTIKQFVC